MTATEPEFITIIEGPTPAFQPTPQRWAQSICEGPEDRIIAYCELRTNNGEDILERCQHAWQEGRTVMLDFPDELRMRQHVNVVAMRLREVEEGQVLSLWVALEMAVMVEEDDADEEDFDEDDDEFDYF
ncbi:MAG: hypothetical protein D6706_12050 [Chloroflexi bacterium]|nr:MAG: hypothetical protein D6706_12050 [Chloroflexota bacterium]